MKNSPFRFFDYLAGPRLVLEISAQGAAAKIYRRGLAGWEARLVKQSDFPGEDIIDILARGQEAEDAWPRVFLFFKQLLANVRARCSGFKKCHLIVPPEIGKWEQRLLPLVDRREIKQALAWEEDQADPDSLCQFRLLQKACRDGLIQSRVLIGSLPGYLTEFFSELGEGSGIKFPGCCLRFPSEIGGRPQTRPWEDGFIYKIKPNRGGLAFSAARPAYLVPLTAGCLLLLAGCFLGAVREKQPVQTAVADAPVAACAGADNSRPSEEISAAAFPMSQPVSSLGAEASLARTPSGEAASAQSLFQYRNSLSPPQPAGPGQAAETDQAQAALSSFSREDLIKNYRLEGVVLGRSSQAVFHGPEGKFVLGDCDVLAGGWKLVQIKARGVTMEDPTGQKLNFNL